MGLGFQALRVQGIVVLELCDLQGLGLRLLGVYGHFVCGLELKCWALNLEARQSRPASVWFTRL